MSRSASDNNNTPRYSKLAGEDAVAGGGVDVNQPNGDFYPSTHPNIAGREREMRLLADSVRRLVMAVCANSASPLETVEYANQVNAISAQLEATVLPDYNRYATIPANQSNQPDQNQSQTPNQPGEANQPQDPQPRDSQPGDPQFQNSQIHDPQPRHSQPQDPRDLFQYDCVLGPYNPLALPLRSEWHPPKAVCRAEFTHPYEGPPGCVHGAVLAAAFDQVFNVANMMSGVAGPTGRLTIHYHKPTPLETPVVFEGEIISINGKKIVTRGTARVENVITVRAEGLFIHMDPRNMTLK